MYGFHCQLANFDAVDDFSKKLAPFRGDADQFCSQLCAIVDGAVDFKTSIPPVLCRHDSSASSLPHTRDKGSGSSSSSSKSNGEEESEVAPPQKKENKLEERCRLQEMIQEHQIGTIIQLLFT